MIQYHKFPQGGFVLHAVPVPGKAWCASAWFDAKGTLVDAECVYLRNGKYMARPTPRGGQVWHHLQSLAPRYVR